MAYLAWSKLYVCVTAGIDISAVPVRRIRSAGIEQANNYFQRYLPNTDIGNTWFMDIF